MEDNPERVVKLLFRKGDPNAQGQIAATALTRKNGGWFTLMGGVPDSPKHLSVITATNKIGQVLSRVQLGTRYIYSGVLIE